MVAGAPDGNMEDIPLFSTWAVISVLRSLSVGNRQAVIDGGAVPPLVRLLSPSLSLKATSEGGG